MSGFSNDELERYARHIVLREVGGAGQQALKRACVAVIGAGGLGAPLLQYLAAAGIGRLRIIDDDSVSLSNLQRQVIYGAADLGRPKVDAAADALARQNPHVSVERFPVRLEVGNAAALLRGADIVADGSDSFETRDIVALSAEAARIPLISAAIGRFDGSITTLKPFKASPDGRAYPRYRDLFPSPPPPGSIPACAEAGVIGALPGVIGSLMAMEVMKELLGIGTSLAGRLLLVDVLGTRFEEIGW